MPLSCVITDQLQKLVFSFWSPGSYFIPDQEGNMRVGGPKSYEAEIIFVFVAK